MKHLLMSSGLALLVALSASLVVAGCGSSDDGGDEAALEQARQEGAQSARQNERIRELEEEVAEAKRQARADAVTVPSAGTPATPASPPPSSYVPTYVPYVPSDPTFGYAAEIPSGGGWSSPIESNPTGGDILRTSLRGPDGTLLIIDRTPTEVPELGGDYDFASTGLRTNFGTATVYTISESESLPDCNGRPCVDIFIDDGAGGGWAVLAGGPSLPVAELIATRVAQSISFGD